MFASTWLSWLLSEIYDVSLCCNFFSSPLCARTEPLLDKKNYWIHREYSSSLSHRSGLHGVWDPPYVRGREHPPKVPNNKLPKKKNVKYFIVSSKFQNFLSKMYLMFLTPQMNIFNKKKNVCIYIIIVAFGWNLWFVFMLELLFLSLVCTDGFNLGQEKLLDTPGVYFLPLT